MKWITLSPEETLTLGRKVLQEFPGQRVICLKGPLGSGKTCFAKGVGEALGIDPKSIKSPTFTTVFEHRTNKNHLIHCDFYRYENASDLDTAWWAEITDHPDSIIVVEWADRIEPHLPIPRLEIKFSHDNEENKRILHLKSIES
jgi:tRNA threonylcarbamoyladenosine biosynthesis protein TsaE